MCNSGKIVKWREDIKLCDHKQTPHKEKKGEDHIDTQFERTPHFEVEPPLNFFGGILLQRKARLKIICVSENKPCGFSLESVLVLGFATVMLHNTPHFTLKVHSRPETFDSSFKPFAKILWINGFEARH